MSNFKKAVSPPIKRLSFFQLDAFSKGRGLKACLLREVLADFESRLPGADFVAIDTELTGVDLEARSANLRCLNPDVVCQFSLPVVSEGVFVPFWRRVRGRSTPSTTRRCLAWTGTAGLPSGGSESTETAAAHGEPKFFFLRYTLIQLGLTLVRSGLGCAQRAAVALCRGVPEALLSALLSAQATSGMAEGRTCLALRATTSSPSHMPLSSESDELGN